MGRTFTFPSAVAAYGIRNYLHNVGLEHKVVENSKKLNEILISYLKDSNLPYVKFNPRYKGLNTADLVNSLKIQEDFSSFRKWIEINKQNL